VTEQTLARARAGDEDAFRELTDPYRRELQLHVYRIVGSAQDAEDLLQETLLAAWRGLERFEERASVRAWLYRIATNRSLDALRASRRRPEDLQQMTEMPEPTRRAEPMWLEPYPDVLLEGIPDDAPGPEARYETKETIALAFIVGLQHLPPQQRAVLVLRDGYRPSAQTEVARASSLGVLTLEGDRISAITWFTDTSVFPSGFPLCVDWLPDGRMLVVSPRGSAAALRARQLAGDAR
jgi:RNA polymerase sigma factor (sigma-70 family)